MSTQAQKQKLNNLVSKRQHLFSRLQSVYDLIGTQVGHQEFILRCSRIDQIFDDFESIQHDIITLCAQMDPVDKIDTEHSTKAFEDIFYRIKTQEKTLNPLIAQPITSTAKLPRISLNIFDGNIQHFNSFISLYNALVHNNSALSDIEKLQYLLTSLKGPALSLVETIEIIPQNYSIAYNALLDRYQNKRILGFNYIHNLVTLPSLPNNSLSGLQRFLDIFRLNYESLKSLKFQDLGQFVLLYHGLKSIDDDTRKSFETKFSSVAIPTCDDLIAFVQSQCKILEIAQGVNGYSDPKLQCKPQSDKKASGNRKNTLITSQSAPSSPVKKVDCYACPLCQSNHKLQQCPKFLEMNVSQRHGIINKLQRCFACFGNKHFLKDCPSTFACKHCNQRSHNSLLHFDTESRISRPTNPSKGDSSNVTVQSDKSVPNTPHAQVLSCTNSSIRHTVILGTAQVYVQNCRKELVSIRIVIDPASQISCMTVACARRLGLQWRQFQTELVGVGATPVPTIKGVINCSLFSRISPSPTLEVEALILPKITGNLPSGPVDVATRNHFSHLALADEMFHKSSHIDLLLGADYYASILKPEAPILIPNEPVAIHTIFGWIIVGKVHTQHTSTPSTSLLIASSQDHSNLSELMHRFWEIEEVSRPPIISKEDELCEQHFLKTHSRDHTGRYIVSLPFSDKPSLGSNRGMALKCFRNLEHRLSHDDKLKMEYDAFMNEYINLNHMQPSLHPSPYVIPHHCVTKESSSSTKLRVVFNASARASQHHSLNDVLYSGPKLQKNIVDIICRFRIFAVALCADIRQMYRQVLVNPPDRQYQHIFWRDPHSANIVEFELNTVTYGVKPSAYLAQRVLLQLASDEGEQFPKAVEALRTQTYVDDIVTGADTEVEAVALQKELINLLAAGKFELRKWSSNSSVVLEGIPESHREISKTLMEGNDCTMKILGLKWDPRIDCFTYDTISRSGECTKRQVMSHIARIFDPLGWLAPTVMFAKVLLQVLWQLKIDWDEPLPPHLRETWTQFQSQLPLLSQVQIPRFYNLKENHIDVIGFSDASSNGYAAVIYFRSKNESNEYFTRLVAAKAKVAPQSKPLTIPRLELCGALLLARLYSSLKSSLDEVNPTSTFFFTDSSIVLAWLKTPPQRLKTFIANRVVEIDTLTELNSWKHCTTQNNAADCASRGLLPGHLLPFSLWWKGPEFLSLPVEQWPLSTVDNIAEVPELKAPSPSTSLVATVPKHPLSSLLDSSSAYLRLIRTVAYVFRFINNVRAKRLRINRVLGPLTTEELNSSLNHCVRHEQKIYFPTVINALLKNKSSLPSRSLSKLSPFFDQNQLLRAGGRLRHSHLKYDQKFPILLPKKSRLSALICDFYHKLTCHAGPRLLQALIQRRFWIISIRDLIRSRISKCVTCCRYTARSQPPKMADLPNFRFHQERAFVNVGVDYGGPFLIKETSRKNSKCTKGYLCLFVCLVTKAVHLEMASDLSTPAFLAAFDRFLSRRGLCSNIYSDNGTNFVGAANHLEEVFQFFKRNEDVVTSHLATKEIKWHFIPPSSPHWGGIWEAGIKSAKHHLRRIIGERPLTFEEFSTLICKIEAILNSRPLCHVSNDPHDGAEYLSPGHFLIGAPLLAPTEPSLSDVPLNRLSRWQLLQHEAQSFWKVWSNTYLQTLIPRSKWTKDAPNLKVGDVVLIRSIPSSPSKWPLGKVEEVITGPDEIVRLVRLKTATGNLLRSVHQLVPLPPP